MREELHMSMLCHAILLGEDLNIIAPKTVGLRIPQAQQMVILEMHPTAEISDYLGMSVKMKVTGFAHDDKVAGFRVKLPAGINALHNAPGTPCVVISANCEPGDTIQSLNEHLSQLKFDPMALDETFGAISTLHPESDFYDF